MSQYMPNTAMTSEPPRTPSGSAAHGGSPVWRWANAPSRLTTVVRPLLWPSTSANMAAVRIAAPIVPPITWPISPPPAGGEPVPPCAITSIFVPPYDTRSLVRTSVCVPGCTAFQSSCLRAPKRTREARAIPRSGSHCGAGGVMILTMPGYAATSLDELPSLWDGFAKLVRAGLGITAFGANVMDLPADYSTKSHDESESGQQELYVALRGAGSVDIDGERLPLDAEHLVRVDAGTARVLSSGPEGLRVLCIGGVPGGVYEPAEWSSSGE